MTRLPQAANDDNQNPEYQMLVELNRRHMLVPWRTIWWFKGSHDRAVSNYLWYLNFEATIREVAVEERRQQIGVIRPASPNHLQPA